MVVAFSSNRPLASYAPVARPERVTTAVAALTAARALRAFPEDESAAARYLTNRRANELAAPSRADISARAGNQLGFVARAGGAPVLAVERLARAGEIRTRALAQDETVRAGTLALTVQGKRHTVTLAGTETLTEVARALQALGARIQVEVTAADDGKQILKVRGLDTGLPAGGSADDALSIGEAYTSASGETLAFQTSQTAENARVRLGGRVYERTSNVISDLVPGTTLRLEPFAEGAATLDDGGGRIAASTPDGTFDVEVESLARAAEAKSEAFASPFSAVRSTSLKLELRGQTYAVEIGEGAVLADVAGKIQGSGAPVDVALVSGDGGTRLRVRARDTGYPVGGAPADALRVTEETSGSSGQALGLAITTEAGNARLRVNGQPIESPSNLVEGGVPGFALDLRRPTERAERLGARPNAGRERPPGLDVTAELARTLQTQLANERPPAPGAARAREAIDAYRAHGDDDQEEPESVMATPSEKIAPGPAAPRVPRQPRVAAGPSPLEMVDVRLALEAELRPPALGSRTRALEARFGPRVRDAYHAQRSGAP